MQCLHVINMKQIKYGYFVCHMNYHNITIESQSKVNMFALFPWQLGLCTRNDDADNVEDDLDDDGDGEGREQQKECATGRD